MPRIDSYVVIELLSLGDPVVTGPFTSHRQASDWAKAKTLDHGYVIAGIEQPK